MVLRSSVDGRVLPLTTDGVPGYEWTLADGRTGTSYPAARWTAGGLRLAAMKVATRVMGQVPRVHWLKTTEEIEWRPFSKAGSMSRGTKRLGASSKNTSNPDRSPRTVVWDQYRPNAPSLERSRNRDPRQAVLRSIPHGRGGPEGGPLVLLILSPAG